MNETFKKRLLRISCLYSLLFLVCVTLSVKLISRSDSPLENTQTVGSIRTEYVYVNTDTDDNITQIYYEDEEQVFIVREHMGKIGIFLPDGTLKEIIEVYVKTLPIADRRLLEEGFEVVGKQQLYSIIEDYSV
ncbi:MAG: hypothetical protein E7653_00455 [Ruminococcaceae bacterium]|nr:hypothetical protein [Oscillospiraceae bacterium]